MKTRLMEKLRELLENRHKIPDEFWHRRPKDDSGARYILYILDRSDGTADGYESSEERLGITKDGKIIWGFSSGCSCWGGWDVRDLKPPVDYKEFVLKPIFEYNPKEVDYNSSVYHAVVEEKADEKKGIAFSEGWEKESQETIDAFLLLIRGNATPKQVLSVGNSEVRRHLIKDMGYANLKKRLKVEVLHVDGTSELFRAKIGEAWERFVKVKDASTEREYLLSVPDWSIIELKTCRAAIAWTFGLTESEYAPTKET